MYMLTSHIQTETTLTLNQVGATDKYNASFTTPADIGTYNVTFSANDTSGNINDTETTFFRITDTTPPKVCNVTPVAGTNFSKDSIVYITANVTDNIKVDKVFANITNPDLTIVLLQLYDTDNNSVYKNTIVANQSGIYYVIIIANDTSGNINNTEGTHFDPASVGHRGSGGGAGRMYRDNLAQWEKQYATSETKKDANPKKCIEYWICDEWTECTTNGYQTRICEDYYKCDTIELKPATEQSCEYKKTDAKNEITGATAESSGFTLFLSKKSNIAFLLGILAIIILTTIIGTALFKYKKKKQISKNKKIQKNKEKILSQLKEVYEK